jgi:hypothetical protein
MRGLVIGGDANIGNAAYSASGVINVGAAGKLGLWPTFGLGRVLGGITLGALSECLGPF